MIVSWLIWYNITQHTYIGVKTSSSEFINTLDKKNNFVESVFVLIKCYGN